MKKITIEWRGKPYIITESEAFAVGELVEEIVTLGELSALAANPRFRKIARVYGVMLRHAGAKATDEEVFSEMMDQIKAGGEGGEQLVVASALSALVEILMDGAPTDGDEGEKKTAASSSKPSRSRSRS
jgi:hypothetical protein